MGSGFPNEKGRDGGINGKKMSGKAGSEKPILDPLSSLTLRMSSPVSYHSSSYLVSSQEMRDFLSVLNLLFI